MNDISPTVSDHTALFERLESVGITHVTVEFDGGGDSGQVESVTASRGETDIEVAAELREAIESACYARLEETGLDWYNNEGGYGSFEFHVSERRIDLDCHTRFTETDRHSFTF